MGAGITGRTSLKPVFEYIRNSSCKVVSEEPVTNTVKTILSFLIIGNPTHTKNKEYCGSD